MRNTDFRNGIDGAALNMELDKLWEALKAVDDWRKLNQRDDGQVRDCRVGVHALHPEVFAFFGKTPPATCPAYTLTLPPTPDFGEPTP